MAYKLKKFMKKKQSVYKRRPKSFSQMTVGSLAKKAWAGVQMIKGLINVEKQFVDNGNALVQPGTTAVVECLNEMKQGLDDIDNRKGDSILMKHLTINYDASVNTSATADVLRVVVVLDKENRGALPAYTDVYKENTTNSFTNPDTVDRFVVLKDERFTVALGGSNIYSGKIYLPLDIHAKYAGTAGDVTDVRENAIFIMFLGSDNTNKAIFKYASRIAFYDN